MSKLDAIACVALAWLAACDAGGEHAAPGPPSCDIRELFTTDGLAEVGCSGAICHSAGVMSLDLESADLEARLLDRSADADGLCAGEILVDSAHPDDSLLLLKVSGMPPCGAPMPLTNPSELTDAQVTCIEEYVHFLAAGGRLGL